jgi:hypothetical protein
MQDNFGLAQKDLIDNLLDNLPSGYTSATVKKPNFKFTTPKNTKWLRITVIPGAKENVQAGGGYKRTSGICVIDCFYPVGAGDQAQLADTKLIEDLYQNLEFDNAKCQEAYTLNLSEEGSWYNQQVNIIFYYEGA